MQGLGVLLSAEFNRSYSQKDLFDPLILSLGYEKLENAENLLVHVLTSIPAVKNPKLDKEDLDWFNKVAEQFLIYFNIEENSLDSILFKKQFFYKLFESAIYTFNYIKPLLTLLEDSEKSTSLKEEDLNQLNDQSFLLYVKYKINLLSLYLKLSEEDEFYNKMLEVLIEIKKLLPKYKELQEKLDLNL